MKLFQLLLVFTFTLGLHCYIDAQQANAQKVEWKTPPTVEKKGDKLVIKFELKSPNDVEISVLNDKNDVVRHLAAGVLGGKLAPPLPLKEGLSQELEWDGKDDFGKAVSVNGCKFRVRAESKFNFGRFIGEDPYTFGDIDGISADEEGNLYVSAYSGTHNQGARTLRVYNDHGEYLRELIPFSETSKPGTMKDVANWDDKSKTWRPSNKATLVPEFYSPRISLLLASQKKGIYFANITDIYAINADGTIKGETFNLNINIDPTKGVAGNPWGYQKGVFCFSASPDGKWLYLTGIVSTRLEISKNFPLGGIYRVRLDDPSDKMKLFVTIPCEYEGSWSKPGSANYGATGPVHYIGIDKNNNIYAPDRSANRVVIFSEDGKQIGEFPVKNPNQVIINPKTSEIYVLRSYSNGWQTHAITLDKYDNNIKNAKLITSYDLPVNRPVPYITCTVKGNDSTIWLAGIAGGIIALKDTGNAFELQKTLFVKKENAQIDWNRLAVDYTRDEFYVADGGNKIWRYDGKTGEGNILKDKNNQPFPAVDLAVGYDQFLYIRTGTGYSGPLERFDRDLSPAPYASGTNVITPYIYSRYGIGNCEKGLGVGPNGEVYITFMYDWTLYAVGGFNNQGKALNGKYLKGKYPTVKPDDPINKLYPKDMNAAIVGPIPAEGGGVRVDLQGNIYVGLGLKKKDEEIPWYMKNQVLGQRYSGSIIKFSPLGGTILGIKDSTSELPNTPRIELQNKFVAENALNIYSGLGPLSGFGECVCRVPRFDVDRFGRIIMPSAFRSNLIYYDNSGNLIAEIGQYGNFDAQLKKPDSASQEVNKGFIPLAWPSGAGFSENHIYANDTYTRRVVRIDKTFTIETLVEIK